MKKDYNKLNANYTKLKEEDSQISFGNITPNITANIFPTKFLNSYFTKLYLTNFAFNFFTFLSIYKKKQKKISNRLFELKPK